MLNEQLRKKENKKIGSYETEHFIIVSQLNGCQIDQ